MLGREGPVLRVQGVVIKSVGGQQENQAAQQDPPDPQAEAVAPLGVRGRRTSNNRWGRGVCAQGLGFGLVWTFTVNQLGSEAMRAPASVPKIVYCAPAAGR